MGLVLPNPRYDQFFARTGWGKSNTLTRMSTTKAFIKALFEEVSPMGGVPKYAPASGHTREITKTAYGMATGKSTSSSIVTDPIRTPCRPTTEDSKTGIIMAKGLPLIGYRRSLPLMIICFVILGVGCGGTTMGMER
jgi:hypothetical protein